MDAVAHTATLRAAGASDLDAVLAIQEKANVASIGHEFTAEHPLPLASIGANWRRAFENGTARFTIAEVDVEAVGVSLLEPPWVQALHVVPEHWGTGVAQALHEDALAFLRTAGEREGYLWVFEGNARARRFWERHGWQETGLT